MKRFTFLFLSVLFLMVSCDESDPIEVSNIPEEFRALDNIFSGEGVGAMVNPAPGVLLLFSKSGTKYAWIEDDELKGTWALNDPEGPIDDMPFSSIGAALMLTDDFMFVVSGDGESYTSCSVDQSAVYGAWDNANPVFEEFRAVQDTEDKWGADGTFPWAGITAAWESSVLFRCQEAETNTNEVFLINPTGNVFAPYRTTGGVTGDEASLTAYTVTNLCTAPVEFYGLPFTSLGAATTYRRNNGEVLQFFVALDGKRFSYALSGEGVFSDTYEF